MAHAAVATNAPMMKRTRRSAPGDREYANTPIGAGWSQGNGRRRGSGVKATPPGGIPFSPLAMGEQLEGQAWKEALLRPKHSPKGCATVLNAGDELCGGNDQKRSEVDHLVEWILTPDNLRRLKDGTPRSGSQSRARRRGRSRRRNAEIKGKSQGKALRQTRGWAVRNRIVAWARIRGVHSTKNLRHMTLRWMPACVRKVGGHRRGPPPYEYGVRGVRQTILQLGTTVLRGTALNSGAGPESGRER